MGDSARKRRLGLCRDCSQPLGETPYARRCVPCAVALRLYRRWDLDAKPWRVGKGRPPFARPEE